ncbi:ABC transporter substrate-binding protein [Clostridium sartagoforme]|uniref:ABC transporter substrate-binding protein n=1 Tax=Clostridium sartagoforme TaxID=84031 RepID=UPI0031D49E06
MKGKKLYTSLIIVSLMAFGMGSYIFKAYNKEKAVINKENEDLEGEIVFVSNRTDKKEELSNLILEFEELHPKTKIKLELIGDVGEVLERRAMLQELPDVTLVPGAIKVSEYDKYFIPIDDLEFTDENIYNYITGLGGDGKLYNLNTSISWRGIIYNKEVFKEAEINDVPRTQEEFFKVCETLKEKGITPFIVNYKQAWTMGPWIDIAAYLFNENLENDVMVENKDILSDSSGVFKALNFVRDIVQNGYAEENLLSSEWQQSKNDIKDGKAAMVFLDSNFKFQLEDAGMDKEHIGIFPLPGSTLVRAYGDYKIGIAKNTEYPEVAKAFLKFIFEEDRYAKAVNIASPLKNNNSNKDLIKELEVYNIPIDFPGNTASKQSKEEVAMHEKYDTLRRLSGLDYSFVQDYITTNDVEGLRNKMNNNWNELEVQQD